MMIVFFLLTDISAHLFFIETYCTYAVSTSPEMHPRKTPFVPQKFTMDSYRTLPFQKSDHHRYAMPRRNTQTQMDVVNYCFPFDQLHSTLSTQISQDWSNPSSQFPKQDLVTILRYKYYVILAFPSHVGHALPILHWLSFAPRDLPKRESLYSFSRRISRALSCLTAKGGGLLKWN